MTAFTINSGGTVEWDSLSGGSVNATLDTYTISAKSTLRIAVDSYQCAGHSSAAGSLDTVSWSGLGGDLFFDGSTVRVLPFNGGSGTVPAIGTTISRSGVSGALLGVWADWQSEPLAAGAAMPSVGYIKLKSVSGGTFAAGALTGISASATGPDVVGWIEIRGANTGTMTPTRPGKIKARGDWFELGVTSGSRGQVLQCPTTGTVAGTFPGVWIETAAGSGVFEHFPSVGSLPADANFATDERGKFIWQTTAGIRIGSDGTNGVGYLPPAGCRVRIPNVILTTCARTAGSGSGPRVLPNATLATRMSFATTNGGAVDLENVVCQWNASIVQAAAMRAYRCAFSDRLQVQTVMATEPDLEDVLAAPTQAQVNIGVYLVSCHSGGRIKNVTGVRYNQDVGSAAAVQFNYSDDWECDGLKAVCLTRANASAGSVLFTYSNRINLLNTTLIGGQAYASSASNVYLKGTRYADTISGSTGTTVAQAALTVLAFCSDITLDGLTFIGTNCHPYTAILSTRDSVRIKMRSIGTRDNPLSCGSANKTANAIVSNSNNTVIRVDDVHLADLRTSFHNFGTADRDVRIQGCSGDYTDTANYLGVELAIRGKRGAGGTSNYAGAFGTHWADVFSSATTGVFYAFANEPSANTVAQAVFTGGTPTYDGSGGVLLTAVGDQVTWEMPYFAKGHTALANSLPTLTGTNTANHSIEFRADTGSGWSEWQSATGANLSAVTIDPSVGVKLAVRATCTVASTSNLLRRIAIASATTAVAQNQAAYPMDTYTLTVNGLATGSRVKITRQDTGAVLLNAAESSGVVSLTTDFTGTLAIEARKASSAPYYQPWAAVASLASGNATVTALQIRDDQ